MKCGSAHLEKVLEEDDRVMTVARLSSCSSVIATTVSDVAMLDFELPR